VANEFHLDMLKMGVRGWNDWRMVTKVKPDLRDADFSLRSDEGLHGLPNYGRSNLRGVNLSDADLRGANFQNANLEGANLRGADLQHANLVSTMLIGANLIDANLSYADMRVVFLNSALLQNTDMSGAVLSLAYLEKTNLSGAKLIHAQLIDAHLQGANLSETDFTCADVSGADLRTTVMVKTNFSKAILSGCRVYGIAAWNTIFDNTTQTDLIITDEGEPIITVDKLEVAQFIYLLLNNEKLRDVIDTITSKAVLILGRFTPERKSVLDAIRGELRKWNYAPILFDCEKPSNRKLTETVITLAGMARFVIADLADPNSIPHELTSFIEKFRTLPVQPIFCPVPGHSDPYPMFEDYSDLPHVLKVYRYENKDELIKSLYQNVIIPAEKKVKELRKSS